jgi:hypothetical protein
MFGSTKRNVGLLAWTAGFVATLAVAAGASIVVPQLINAEEPPAATSSATVEAAATVDTTPVVAEVAPEVAAPEVAPEVVEVEVTTPPPTKATPKVTVPPTIAVVEAPAPTLPPVTVPALAPRTVPSPAQVQSAIAGITSLVQLPFFIQISAANVADVGNRVCTAFDQGQTMAQVQAVGLAQVAAYVTVSPAAADYAVRTAVALYCPAYASKLV